MIAREDMTELAALADANKELATTNGTLVQKLIDLGKETCGLKALAPATIDSPGARVPETVDMAQNAFDRIRSDARRTMSLASWRTRVSIFL